MIESTRVIASGKLSRLATPGDPLDFMKSYMQARGIWDEDWAKSNTRPPSKSCVAALAASGRLNLPRLRSPEAALALWRSSQATFFLRAVFLLMMKARIVFRVALLLMLLCLGMLLVAAVKTHDAIDGSVPDDDHTQLVLDSDSRAV